MSPSTIPPLRSDVRQIRPRRVGVRWTLPDAGRLRTWVSRLGHETSRTLLTILGPNPAYRAEAYRMLEGGDIFNVVVDKSNYCYDWIDDTLLGNLSKRISVPNILGILAARNELLLSPDLTQLLDFGYFRVSEAFKVLWEVRFLHEEGQADEAEFLMQALAEWSVGHPLSNADHIRVLSGAGVKEPVTTPEDRYDMILLWLTLARSNGILDRIVLPYDGFERAQDNEEKISELSDLIQATDRWATMGCPLGIVVGVQDLQLPQRLKELLLDSVV
jgi:hypothetical protein